jgi:hypothetical protein
MRVDRELLRDVQKQAEEMYEVGKCMHVFGLPTRCILNFIWYKCFIDISSEGLYEYTKGQFIMYYIRLSDQS